MTSFSLILSSLFRGSADDAYTIFGGTANEARVFCDMTGASTGCNGGGWTLVMRIDGHKVLSSKNSMKTPKIFSKCFAYKLRKSHFVTPVFKKKWDLFSKTAI